MSTPIETAATLVIADTCSVLDLARSASRPQTLAGEIASAIQLVELATSKPEVLIVAVCDVTEGEYDNNIQGVLDGARADLNEVFKRMVHANSVSEHLGLTPILAPGHAKKEWVDAIVNRGEATARNVLDSAMRIETTADDRELGYRRSVERRPPAKQGSSASMFDCIITECCLRTAAGRQPAPSWLVTSNRADFYPDGSLPATLAAEFEGAGLQLCRSWTELATRLNL